MSYRNLSTLDRTVRIVLGLAMLAASWTGVAGGIWKAGLEVFGWVPLVTGVIGWCPLYALLGFSTFKAAERDRQPVRRPAGKTPP